MELKDALRSAIARLESNDSWRSNVDAAKVIRSHLATLEAPSMAKETVSHDPYTSGWNAGFDFASKAAQEEAESTEPDKVDRDKEFCLGWEAGYKRGYATGKDEKPEPEPDKVDHLTQAMNALANYDDLMEHENQVCFETIWAHERTMAHAAIAQAQATRELVEVMKGKG